MSCLYLFIAVNVILRTGYTNRDASTFIRFIDALRAYDAYTVRRKREKTQKSDLNLPKEWAFPTPLGACPPVHSGGDDSGSPVRSSSSSASSSGKKLKKDIIKETGGLPIITIDDVEKEDEASSKEKIKETDTTPTVMIDEKKDCKKEKAASESNKKVLINLNVKDGASNAPMSVPAGNFPSNPKSDELQASANDSRVLPKSKAAALYVSANKRRLLDATEDTVKLGNSQAPTKAIIDLIDDADPNDAAPKPAPALKGSRMARSAPKKGPPSSNKVTPHSSNGNSEKKNSPPEAAIGKWACHKCTKDNPAEHRRCGVCFSWKGGRRENSAKKKKKSTTLISPPGGKSSQVNKVPVMKSTVTKPSPANPSVTENESKHPALQAPEYGDNWTVRKIPRANGTNLDRYFYSPVMGYRFRSKPEVNRFLECVKQSNGDEILAIGKFRSSKKNGQSKKRPRSSSKTSSSSLPASKYRLTNSFSPVKVTKSADVYIEPSVSSEENNSRASTPEDDSNNKYIKPVIKHGAKVYACWSGPDGKGAIWYPGRVWDSKVKPGSGEFGPIHKYDIVYDDGDMEPRK